MADDVVFDPRTANPRTGRLMSDDGISTVNEADKLLGIGIDAAGRSRVASTFGILDFKNVDSRNPDLFHEYLVGAILEHGAVTGGPFQLEVVTDDVTGAEATVTTVGTGYLTVTTLDLHHFGINGITGKTSGAKATLTSTDTGSLISHSYDESGVKLTIPGNDGDVAARQSVRRASYVTGNAQLTSITYVPDATSAAEIAFVVRSSVSGTPTDARIVQSDGSSPWNIDNLDGNGPSGIALNKSFSQVALIDFLWLGHSHVRWGFADLVPPFGAPIMAHVESHANKSQVPYMRQPSLPLRWEISRTGGFIYKRFGNFDERDGVFIEYKEAIATAPLTITETCGSVKSEGGYELPGLQFTASRNLVRKSVSAIKPIFAIRPKTEFPTGELNQRTVQYIDVGCSTITNNAILRVIHAHGVKKFESSVGVPATWTDVDSSSSVQYSTDVDIITALNKHFIDEIFMDAGGPSAKGSGAVISGEYNAQHSFLSGRYSLTIGSDEAFIIYAIPETSPALVECHITFKEGN